jgi:Flp pilus assembly protein TadG
MILPLLVTLYFGSVELLQGLSVDRKVTQTSRTIADLVAQSTSIDSTAMTNIFAASRGVMIPYPESELTMTVTAVNIDGSGKATVAWSQSSGKSPQSKSTGSGVTLPPALVVNNTQLIWSEASYDFKPTIGYFITGTLKLKDQLYMRPRLSDKVCNPPTPC